MSKCNLSIKSGLKIWKCPQCENTSSIDNWDSATINICTSREDRRSFKSLGIASCRVRGSHRAYVCPACGEAVLGHKIKEEI